MLSKTLELESRSTDTWELESRGHKMTYAGADYKQKYDLGRDKGRGGEQK